MRKYLMNFQGEGLQKQVDDKDFLDINRLEGRVYRMMLHGMMLATPEERHHVAMHIIVEVANEMFPACPGCGKKCEDTRCQNCKYKQQGVLGNI